MAFTPEILTTHPSIVLFKKIFRSGNKLEARSYFEQAIQSIYRDEKATLNGILGQFDLAYELATMINPKEEPEIHLCAQYILCHIIGMHKINQPCYLDKRIAIKFIKLSHIALERLQKNLIGNSIIGNSKQGIRHGNKTMRGESQKAKNNTLPKIPSTGREWQVQTP